MKPLRILIAGLSVLIIVVGGTVAIALHDQARLVRVVLARIYVETGYNIVPSGARLAFHSHLIVTLEKPTIYLDGNEVARVDDLRAVVRYHTIFHSSGLPLYMLAFDHPRVRMPANLAGVTPHGFPKPDVAAANRLKSALDSISDVAQRVEIVNAALDNVDGEPLIDHLTLTAYRQHRGPGHWPWMVSFNAAWKHAPFDGVALTGKFRLGVAPGVESTMAASGHVDFHGLELAPFNGPYGIQTAGVMAGTLRFGLRRDGELIGKADSSVARLVLEGRPFTAPIALGDLSVHVVCKASVQRFELKEITVTQQGAALLTGGGAIDQPYEDLRTAAIHLEDVRIPLTRAAAWMRLLRDLPAPIKELVRRAGSGEIALSKVAFNPQTPVKNWDAETLRDNLSAQGNISGVGFDPPKQSKLPPLRRGEAAFAYAGRVVKLRQGSAALGKSTLTGVTAEVNLGRAPKVISYKLRSKGVLDADDLYPALAGAVAANAPDFAEHIARVSGASSFDVAASGTIANMNWSAPADYRLKLSPRSVEIAIKDAPSAIAVNGGSLELRPDAVQINQLIAAVATPGGGKATFNGTIVAARPHPIFRNFVADFSAFRTETWLPPMIDPRQIDAQGPISGRLTAQTDANHPAVPQITGDLTMGPGQLQFSFLRSPISVKSMKVVLDGRGLKVDIPNGQLEGHPVVLNISLDDFAHPLIQLDAKPTDLDFEVMRFIRMPWSPKGPSEKFDLPIEGHIAADRANFGKLSLRTVSTDFDRMNGAWHVRNFTGKALAGRLKLDISGVTGPSNLIHLKVGMARIDAAALCTLLGESSPAISGRLNATGDLTATTDVNFFGSLDGKISILAAKGTLNRFVLLTRVLSFIDLKNWLTARLPDPRVAGIPFTTLTATLDGLKGVFHTNDLRLSGPVMEITARGDLRLTDNTIDMEISMIPFDTVSWLLGHIPLIGKNLAGGSHDLIAAYFQVSGPIANPSVVPKPITSVAEFVAKTLSLPINLIAPNTIKP